MNNLEQTIKELCHQNYIGSEKCGECEGGGIDELEDTTEIDCEYCKGKGYIIPTITFGDELQFKDGIKKFIRFSSLFYIVSDGKAEYSYGEDPITLGKPLTLQMVLRLLPFEYVIDKDGTIWEVRDVGNLVTLDKIVKIDLTKDLKDQEPSVLSDILDIVK